jgi:hypothetical protein
MLDLFSPLDTTFRTISADLEKWFSAYPQDAAWNVVSDYCIGDPQKNNDTIAFSIIAHHDTTENTRQYIAAVAPTDIKSTRQASLGLRQYLKCPVTFSVTYVVSRSSALLRDYIDTDNMRDFLPDFEAYLRSFDEHSLVSDEYFDSVYKRMGQFKRDVEKNKQFNAKLARQVYMVAAFAASVFKHLTLVKKPAYIRWISDRDAILDRYDALVYDVGYLYFLLQYGQTLDFSAQNVATLIDKPRFVFEIPEKTGKNINDELVRLPDHLAGTLADFDIEARAFTHEKFSTMFDDVFVNSPNNTVIQVLGDASRVTTRRLAFHI